MKHWVIDTNVVVSGLLNPSGAPARVLDAVVRGQVRMVYDARILREYRDVLHRPKFKLGADLIDAFLESLRGQLLVNPKLISVTGPDPDDLIFIEAALSVPDMTLVTGNLVHFPVGTRNGVRVINPAEACAELKPTKSR